MKNNLLLLLVFVSINFSLVAMEHNKTIGSLEIALAEMLAKEFCHKLDELGKNPATLLNESQGVNALFTTKLSNSIAQESEDDQTPLAMMRRMKAKQKDNINNAKVVGEIISQKQESIQAHIALKLIQNPKWFATCVKVASEAVHGVQTETEHVLSKEKMSVEEEEFANTLVELRKKRKFAVLQGKKENDDEKAKAHKKINLHAEKESSCEELIREYQLNPKKMYTGVENTLGCPIIGCSTVIKKKSPQGYNVKRTLAQHIGQKHQDLSKQIQEKFTLTSFFIEEMLKIK